MDITSSRKNRATRIHRAPRARLRIPGNTLRELHIHLQLQPSLLSFLLLLALLLLSPLPLLPLLLYMILLQIFVPSSFTQVPSILKGWRRQVCSVLGLIQIVSQETTHRGLKMPATNPNSAISMRRKDWMEARKNL